MTAAVVPRQTMRWHGEGDTVVQDGIHIVVFRFIFIDRLRLEEGGRRHLLRITHDDNRSAARNGTDSLASRYLRGFIENH